MYRCIIHISQNMHGMHWSHVWLFWAFFGTFWLSWMMHLYMSDNYEILGPGFLEKTVWFNGWNNHVWSNESTSYLFSYSHIKSLSHLKLPLYVKYVELDVNTYFVFGLSPTTEAQKRKIFSLDFILLKEEREKVFLQIN